MKLITAYKIPDLDGSASAYAYAELLNRLGQDAKAVVFGGLRHEAQFPFDYVKVHPSDGDEVLQQSDEIILTDASEIIGISDKINPEKVIEIIDHRKSNDVDKFINAKIKVDLIGSCATLITEKFNANKVKPSRESAILLYLAIISNTINLKNKITSSRDIEAANYLKSLYKIDDNLVRQFFIHKSDLSEKTIKEIFVEDGFVNIHEGKRFTIFQIEIVGVDKFIKENLAEIIIELENVKVNDKTILIFLTCIDLEKGENTFVSSDAYTKKFLIKTFGVKFNGNIAKHRGIIMRKEIVPLVKQYLS